MSLRPGDRLVGGYEVLQLIGRGAHGVVLKVRGPGNANRLRAVKVLPCDHGSSSLGAAGAAAAAAESRDAAYREARLLQRLRYPHIVTCEDVLWDYQRRSVLLVLDFMDGGDLRGLIEAKKNAAELFEAHFARRVLAAVGGALAYIHRAGVLHRDVKPANVLLTRHSHRIKLADFGIAKLLESSLNAHTVVGTPHYLSPEIVAGKAYGEASDSWALGVCLYEVATTQRPFDASNQLALVRRICEEPFPPLPDSTAADICRAIEGMLQKPVADRLLIPEALLVSSAVAALVVGGVTLQARLRPAPTLQDATEEAKLVAALPSVSSSPSSCSEAATPGCSPDFLGSGSPSSVSGSWPSASVATGTSSPCQGSSGRAEPDKDAGEAKGAQRWSLHSASGDVWAELEASWCSCEAANAARDALGGDVDDPEELVRALANLEKEHEDGLEPQESTVLETLESELRVRIAALRTDAAAMLESAEAEALADEEHEGPKGAIPLINGLPSLIAKSDHTRDLASISSSPRPSMLSSRCATAFEQALEVATSLGVDTDPCEERLARKRGMLSLRVKWCGVARFCLLPVNVGFDSLTAEVSRRFGLPAASALPAISWQEAGESFQLRSQASWEECLQRRGLVAQPGRLELCVESNAPPPVSRTILRGPQRVAALEAFASAPSPLGHRSELFSWRPGASGAPGVPGGRTGHSREVTSSSFYGNAAVTMSTSSSLRPANGSGAARPLRASGHERDAGASTEAAHSTVSSLGYGARSPQGTQASAASLLTLAAVGITRSSQGPEKRPCMEPQGTTSALGTRSRPCIQVRCKAPTSSDSRERVSPHGAASRNLQVNGRSVPLQ